MCVCVCGGGGGGGGTMVVINHSITHLSEFRQAGEREGQRAGRREGEIKRMEECSREKRN